jgi:anti-sigma regulatory factor (Ser/Thr protein kinase)
MLHAMAVEERRAEDLQVVAELAVAADAEMLTVCRVVLAGVAAGLPVSDEGLDDLKLVLSEACASAIEHAGDPQRRIDIQFRVSEGELDVCVRDTWQPPELALSGRGFGRPLLRQLCSRFEVAGRPDGPGTVVRFARTLPA